VESVGSLKVRRKRKVEEKWEDSRKYVKREKIKAY
jgi:hypothetical protein